MDAEEEKGYTRLLLSLCSTDMPKDECVGFVYGFADHADGLSISSCSGLYNGDIDSEAGLWLANRDEGL